MVRSIIVPTLWIGNGTTRANLVADGLASILPNSLGPKGRAGCIGRHAMADKIADTLKKRIPMTPTNWTELKLQAARDDLAGS